MQILGQVYVVGARLRSVNLRSRDGQHVADLIDADGKGFPNLWPKDNETGRTIGNRRSDQQLTRI
jgi:hypothetical protein